VTIRRLAVCALVLAAAAPGRTASSTVPVPQVARVPAGTPGGPERDYPFFATDIVLSNYGYVEEEFFFTGAANTYTSPPVGTNADVQTTGTPYRSRLLVRRPSTRSRFNGVVVVEWFNVTNGYDTDVLWLYQKEFLIREGYAWVGVSAQSVGVSRPPNGLKIWSPKRYGSLDVDGAGKVISDALGYDIYSQAAAAVRHVPQILGGLTPRLVIAAGQSQSAGRLATYLNAIHPRDPIYDAALMTVNAAAIRTDLTIPVIKVLSETETNTSRNQADADRIRTWTVAGATHSEQYSLVSRAAFLKRDLNLQAVDACETPARSRVEIRYVYNAAIDALVRWVTRATPPPHAPPLTFVGDMLQRDEHGNALGGIRLAEMAAPVANESALLCGLGGTHVPFDAATLATLYPTHEAYVSKVSAAVSSLVSSGFMLKADGDLTIGAARRSIYGERGICGPLCADVRQFPANPSSMLLARQTAALLIKDGDALVRILDVVTRTVALAYASTDGRQSAARFAEAAAGLRFYITRTQEFLKRGNLSRETASLLVDQATTLLHLVEGKTK